MQLTMHVIEIYDKILPTSYDWGYKLFVFLRETLPACEELDGEMSQSCYPAAGSSPF